MSKILFLDKNEEVITISEIYLQKWSLFGISIGSVIAFFYKYPILKLIMNMNDSLE